MTSPGIRNAIGDLVVDGRPVQEHPAYREGFDDALAGDVLPIDATPAYVEGWLAAYECKALLEHGGRGTVRAEWQAWREGRPRP